MRPKFPRNPYGWGVLASALALPALVIAAGTPGGAVAGPERAELEKQFSGTIQPFVQKYCAACHGKDKPAAQLDLTAFTSIDSVLRDYPHWALALEKMAAKQMPPAGVETVPSDKERDAVIAWIRAVRVYDAQRNAGDPGPVLARRLSNAEYDYTIRDLTGQDLHPTREFPVDPANQEGFDNSGESLTLSAALVKKYMQAAKEISDHAVLTSTGIEFASHPVLAETDRDRYCILRIVDFYKRQPTDYADYFFAAWRYKNRAALGMPNATLKSVAADAKVSPKYLELVWNTLTLPDQKLGPISQLQGKFNALPAPDKSVPDAAKPGCMAMRDWVVGLRKKVAWTFPNMKVPRGFSTGGACFVLWKDEQYASHRRMLYTDNLQIGGVPKIRVIPAHRGENGTRVPETSVTDPVDPETFVPEDPAEQAACLASFTKFCDVFPDAFYIAARRRMFVNERSDSERPLSAGFHNVTGYFRDDTPLMELILDDKGQQELNHMWQDFNMVAFVPERMHLEFFTYERSEASTITDQEFDPFKAEDKINLSDERIKRFAELYRAKAARNGADALALAAIDKHFVWVRNTVRTTEKERLAAEPVHRQALLDFARRAYRRPLTDAEKADILGFYSDLRKKDGLTHEDAVRDSIARILLSPNFLFLDLGSPSDGGGKPAPKGRPIARGGPRLDATPPSVTNAIEPLSDYALANRLSYFLWASMPDDELLRHAAAGDLHKPEVLVAQARRMMKDPRIRALALEWGGNWLDFRRFEELNSVDRDRFPAFTNDLREAMFQEPLRFLTDEIQNNRSVLDALYGKYTFVNATLAKHYGMDGVKASGNEWVRVDDADRYGRGGLLPMAAFLTKNSPGLRTSPVKRGYWVVRRLLGEYIPPPPATVPELPKDESKMGEKTLRQALEQHRQNPACAACHARFDSYGLVFEGYGPIGELRKTDLGGRPVDNRAPFPGGADRSGVTGLESFIGQQRQRDFTDTLARKLLSYALGRSLQASDDPLLFTMHQRLVANDYRFGALVETIVTSKQFRYRRSVAASDGSAIARN